ncbi:MAG: hypothetical protein FWE32_12020 [Oscillospiraceae bacterium]|nr:hypothetical protein [Oscillospiraceae bacterium]
MALMNFIQNFGIVFFAAGMFYLLSPAALAESKNKKRIKKGDLPMTEEETARQTKKARITGAVYTTIGAVCLVFSLYLRVSG